MGKKDVELVLRVWKMTIAYKGSSYCGWQRQAGVLQNSVQGVVEDSLRDIFKDNTINLQGSGRTDAGVHALGQVASIEVLCHESWSAQRLLQVLQHRLPSDIFVRDLVEWPLDLHARFSALGKSYFYVVSLRDKRNLFMEELYLHYKYKLDVEKIRLSAKILEGTHDFTGFAAKKKIMLKYVNEEPVVNNVCKYRSPAKPKGNVRTIYNIEIVEREGFLFFIFHGNGFLYKMVRSLVGHLLWVGSDRCNAEDTEKILAGAQRTTKVETAPARGLYLGKVYYENEQWQDYDIFNDPYFPAGIMENFPRI